MRIIVFYNQHDFRNSPSGFQSEKEENMARRGENIYKRKDGRYEGRYIKRYDTDGKAIYGYVYDKNYAVVKEKLNKCRMDDKPKPTGSNTLLSEWLLIWIESETGIKDSTRQLYKRHIRNHIVPKLGKVQLKKLNADMIQRFIDSLDLSPSTVKLVFNVLESGLNSAEEKGLISNIWAKVKLPKRKKLRSKYSRPTSNSSLKAY